MVNAGPWFEAGRQLHGDFVERPSCQGIHDSPFNTGARILKSVRLGKGKRNVHACKERFSHEFSPIMSILPHLGVREHNSLVRMALSALLKDGFVGAVEIGEGICGRISVTEYQPTEKPHAAINSLSVFSDVKSRSKPIATFFSG